ncbi:hypothetical protein Tco_1169673 [Tanacetum coccineum]
MKALSGEGAEDEGPTVEDEDPAAGDEGLVTGDEGPGDSVRGGLDAQCIQSRQPTLTTWIDPEDGTTYIDVPAYPPPAPPVQTPPSPEWSSGSLLVSPAPSIVPSCISSPMIPLTVPLPIASPATAEAEGFLTELGAQVEMQRGLIHDHTRPVLALESWAGQTDAQRAALWYAISDTQMENRELRLQITEERRVRLDLAEIIDGMRRGAGAQRRCVGCMRFG